MLTSCLLLAERPYDPRPYDSRYARRDDRPPRGYDDRSVKVLSICLHKSLNHAIYRRGSYRDERRYDDRRDERRYDDRRYDDRR